MKKIKIFFYLLTASVPSFAQDSTFNKEKELSDVVVTATRGERKLGNLAIPVQLITGKTIRETGSLRLQDILQEQTGLLLVNSPLGAALNGYPNPFGHGVQLLGLDPAYTLILIDGEPLIGRNGGILKLGRLATGTIKQVEIVKGPSSSLYGSEAMAGVINIITESPGKENGELQLQHASNGTWGSGLAYRNRLNRTGIQVYLHRYATEGYDLDKTIYGKTVDPYRDWNGKVKLTQELNNRLQLTLSTRFYDSKQDNDYRVNWQGQPAIAKGATRENEYSTYFQLRWQKNKEQKIYLRFFYDRYQNRSFVNLDKTSIHFDETSFDQSLLKPELSYEINKKENRLVTGLGSGFEMIDASRYAGKRQLSTLYSFLQKEWSLFDHKLTLIAGGRTDKRSDFKPRLSPRIAAAFRPGKNWKFTAAAGWGFKAPDFRHLYLSFYNEQIGYSLIGSRELYAQLNQMQQQGLLQPGADISAYANYPDLLPETSHGFHTGVVYAQHNWKIEAGLFRNDIRNLIDNYSLPFSRSNGQPIFSYRNIHKVYTQGVSADLRYRVGKELSVSAGYQFLDAKDKEILRLIREQELYKRDPNTYVTTLVKRSDYIGLFNRSRHSGNIKMEWEHRDWNIYARAIYRGPSGFTDKNGNAIADDPSEMIEGYWLVNMALQRSIASILSIQAGIENIFGYTNPVQLNNIPGRLFFLNLNYNFLNEKRKHKKTIQ